MSFVNSPSILNSFPKFNTTIRKTLVSGSGLRTLKQSLIVSRRSIRLKKTIENRIVIGGSADECVDTAVSAFEHEAFVDNGVDSNHQTPGVLHTVLNRLSKWCVVVTLGGIFLLRHDALSLWTAMGGVVNTILSLTLKKILNQDRPVSDVKSGPGMPSSHAQSISFATMFTILSIVELLGLNRFSAILSGLVIAVGVYFTWLRVLLHYHTMSQVVVGAVVGYIFSELWFSSWGAVVLNAYNSYLWVKVLVVFGCVCSCLAIISHVVLFWTKYEH